MSDQPDLAAEYAPRIARVRDAMQAVNADLLVVDQAELMQWLGGFTSSETLYRVLLVPAQGEPWYVIRDIDRAPCVNASWVSDIVSYEDENNPWQVVMDSIIAKGFANAHIAFDHHSYGCTVESWSKLSHGLGEAQFVALDTSGDVLRQVKFTSEIANLKRAARIADHTMQTINEQIRLGDSAREAAAIASASFMRLGADSGDAGPIVRSSGDNEFLHSHQLDEPLQTGDVLHVELIPKVANYSARLMRPMVFGAASEALKYTAKQLIEIQDQQIAAMKTGVKACDIDRIVREQVLATGLRSSYTNVTGYALGLYARTPRLSDFSLCFHPKAEWLLEENMVFHMYISAGRLGFSETVRVGKEGGERLTTAPRTLLQC